MYYYIKERPKTKKKTASLKIKMAEQHKVPQNYPTWKVDTPMESNFLYNFFFLQKHAWGGGNGAVDTA